jgi:hypothetical protein
LQAATGTARETNWENKADQDVTVEEPINGKKSGTTNFIIFEELKL